MKNKNYSLDYGIKSKNCWLIIMIKHVNIYFWQTIVLKRHKLK